MRILLVHNAEAGDGEFSPDALLRLIRDAGHTAEYVSVGDRRWREALAEGIDVIAAAGGDGTVAKVARSVAGSGVPIAIIPLGTANNIAGALGLSARAIPDLVAGWAAGRRQPFDVGVAVGAGAPLRFLESAGVGLLARTIARIMKGDAGYVDELTDAEERIEAALDVLGDELQRLTPVHADLLLDGQPLSGDFVLLEVLNFGGAGANLRLAHGADPADGLFDVVTVTEAGRQELLDNLTLYRNDPARAPRLPVQKARQVTLTCGPCELHLDDKLRTFGTDGSVALALSLEQGALTFLV